MGPDGGFATTGIGYEVFRDDLDLLVGGYPARHEVIAKRQSCDRRGVGGRKRRTDAVLKCLINPADQMHVTEAVGCSLLENPAKLAKNLARRAPRGEPLEQMLLRRELGFDAVAVLNVGNGPVPRGDGPGFVAPWCDPEH